MIAMKIKNSILTMVALFALLLLPAQATRARAAAPEGEVRAVVQRVFEQLKSRQYNSLYEVLPSTVRARASREQFSAALRRMDDTYQLDRMDIGAVRVMGTLAVVDTVIYGRVLRPINGDGKIVVQQYLVREEGSWRVATGDNQTIRRFLAANPAFGKKFSIRAARVYVKNNGRWMEVNLSRLPRPRSG